MRRAYRQRRRAPTRRGTVEARSAGQPEGITAVLLRRPTDRSRWCGRIVVRVYTNSGQHGSRLMRRRRSERGPQKLAEPQCIFGHLVVIEEDVRLFPFRQRERQLFELAVFILITPAGPSMKPEVGAIRSRSFVYERINYMPQAKLVTDGFDDAVVPISAWLPSKIQALSINRRNEFLKAGNVLFCLSEASRTLEEYRPGFQCSGGR